MYDQPSSYEPSTQEFFDYIKGIGPDLPDHALGDFHRRFDDFIIGLTPPYPAFSDFLEGFVRALHECMLAAGYSRVDACSEHTSTEILRTYRFKNCGYIDRTSTEIQRAYRFTSGRINYVASEAHVAIQVLGGREVLDPPPIQFPKCELTNLYPAIHLSSVQETVSIDRGDSPGGNARRVTEVARRMIGADVPTLPPTPPPTVCLPLPFPHKRGRIARPARP